MQIHAGGQGVYDKLPVSEVRPAAEALVQFLKDRYANILHDIRSSGKIDDVDAQLKQAEQEFVAQFKPASAELAA